MSTIVTRAGKGSPLTNTELDSNFSNLNTDKAELSGSTFTGNLSLGDNVKAQFGASDDLQIFSNGSTALLKAGNATSDIRIESDNRIVIADRGFNEAFAVFNDDSDVKLYHDGSQKLATTSTGISISNDANFPDNGKAIFGASDDLQIYSDGTDGYIDNVTGDFYIRDTTGGTLHLQAKSNEEGIVIHDDGGVDIYRNNDIKLSTTSTGIDVTGNIESDSVTIGVGSVATTEKLRVNGTVLTLGGSVSTPAIGIGDVNTGVYAPTAGTLGWTVNGTQRLLLDSTGIDVTGSITTDGMTTSADINFGDDDKALFGAGNDLKIYHSANNQSYIHEVNADGSLFILGTHIVLQNSSGQDAITLINGDAYIKSGGQTKLQTTATGADISGVLTADGLTVEGVSALNGNTTIAGTLAHSSSGGLSVKIGLNNASISSSTDCYIGTHTSGGMGSTSGDMVLIPRSNANSAVQIVTGNGTPTKTATFSHNGDISFYEDTGTTPKLFWDASTERLGLGATSPSAPIHVIASSPELRLQDSDDNGYLSFNHNGANSYISTTQGALLFRTGGTSEKFRINADGSSVFSGSVTADGLTVDGNSFFTTADNSAQVTLISTDTDALSGPRLNLWRNSGTGTNGDLIGEITFTGEDTVGSTNVFASISSIAEQTNNGAEDGSLHFNTLLNGTLAKRLSIGSTSTGGDISFYNSAGTSQDFFWDSSTSRLGLGVTNPASTMHVNSGANGEILRVQGADAQLRINNSTSNVMDINSSGSGDSLTLSTGDTAALTLDSSQNASFSGSVSISGTSSLSTEFKIGNLTWNQNSSSTSGLLHQYRGSDGYSELQINNTSTSGAVALNIRNASTSVATINNDGSSVFSGSVTAPLLITNDIKATSSGGMSFQTDEGTKRLEISDAGNVNIPNGSLMVGSTTAPSAPLDIKLNTNSTADIFKFQRNDGAVAGVLNYSGTDGAISLGTTTSHDLTFDTANTERLRIASNGTLYHGKTADSLNTGGLQTLISGQTSITQSYTEPLRLNRMSSEGAIQKFYYNGAEVGSIGTQNSDLSIGTGVVGIYFQDGGNRYIPWSTTTNSQRDAAIDIGYSGGRFKDLYLSNNATAQKLTLTKSPVGLFTIEVDGTNTGQPNLIVKKSTSEALRIDNNNNLLVGTTSQFSIGRVCSLAADGVASFETKPSADISYNAVMFLNSSNSQVGRILCTSSATSYVTSSDCRLKDNIKDCDDSGSKIDAVKVRQFDWKADGSHQDYGMIAQELQTVAPEAVSGDADSEDMMGVDYSKLVPMLIKEIQSLRQRVAQLEE